MNCFVNGAHEPGHVRLNIEPSGTSKSRSVNEIGMGVSMCTLKGVDQNQ